MPRVVICFACRLSLLPGLCVFSLSYSVGCKIQKLPVDTITMKASNNVQGLDSDERLIHHGVLQQAQGGAGARTALDDDDMHRMGKIQEFKACLLPTITTLYSFLTFSNREIYDLWLH